MWPILLASLVFDEKSAVVQITVALEVCVVFLS